VVGFDGINARDFVCHLVRRTGGVKFIHAADLHIDSPLRGLEAYEGAPVRQLRLATRQAFRNLVDLAIAEQVDFLIIAGDLFDGSWQDMRTGLWTAAQFRDLQRAGVRVFLLRGNHDAASRVRRAITWPANVHEFSTKRPETIQLDELGVALHGQGFDQHETTEDLAASYPDAVAGYFNIGVLHTSLSGSRDHDTYAPTTVDILTQRGYDYWALGHIHARSDPPVQELPRIAYSGNTQGRHIRETGAKGCLLVTVDDGVLDRVDFRATDTLRWHLADVSLTATDGCDELLAAVRRELESCRENSQGRFAAVRVLVRGACAAHRELVDSVRRLDIVTEIRNLANDLDDEVWIEKVAFDTVPPVDVERLQQGHDMLGQLLRSVREALSSPEQLQSLADDLRSLSEKAEGELHAMGLRLDDPQQMALWARQAEGILISRLAEAEE
jgi:exonuclease SbcD